jgi:predicted secreted protein
MKSQLFVKTLAVGCLIACTACQSNPGISGGGEKTEKMKDTVIIEGCQPTVDLSLGTVAEFRLEAVAGTGYQWLLKNPSPLVQQLDTGTLHFLPADGKDTMTGKAGYQLLYFKTLQKGEGELWLEYRRTFEEGVEKTCRMKLRVQ